MDPDLTRIVSDWARYVISGVVGGGIALWSSLGRRDRQLGERIAQVAAECRAHGLRLERVDATAVPLHGPAGLSERITALESSRGTLVTREHLDGSLTRAHARMDGLEKGLAEIAGRLTGIDSSLGRIEQHLLEHGPRAGDPA